jgi:hypothetical protein
MPSLPVFKKLWRLKLWRGNSLIVLAAPLMGQKTLFNESLESIYKDKGQIVFSQFVDENQWNIGDRSEFMNGIVARHLVRLAVTADYSEKRAPKKEDHTYVLHGLALPRFEFLNDVLHFGMTSLPNIIYSYREDTVDWLSKILDWNKHFLTWYQFKTSDKFMAHLMNQIGLTSWTSDYYLSFGITNIEQLIDVLNGLQEVADGRNLSLVINTKSLTHPIES